MTVDHKITIYTHLTVQQWYWAGGDEPSIMRAISVTRSGNMMRRVYSCSYPDLPQAYKLLADIIVGM